MGGILELFQVFDLDIVNMFESFGGFYFSFEEVEKLDFKRFDTWVIGLQQFLDFLVNPVDKPEIVDMTLKLLQNLLFYKRILLFAILVGSLNFLFLWII